MAAADLHHQDGKAAVSDLNRTPALPTPHPNSSPSVVAREWPVFNEIDLDPRMWRELDPVERALRMARNNHAWWAHHRLAKAQATREATQ